MEDLCKFDISVMYIMEQETPNYSIIGRYINTYILPYQFEMFTMITKTIIDEFNLDISVQYLDVTKLKANANKYKFVWKPTTYHKKLDIIIKEILEKMNIEFKNKNLIKSYQLNVLINDYAIKIIWILIIYQSAKEKD